MKRKSFLYYRIFIFLNLFLFSSMVSAQIPIPPIKALDVTNREFQTQQLLDIRQVIMGGPIDPATYKMGPGDQILVRIGGISPEPIIQLVVLPEGVVNIPDVGIADLNDITLAQSQELIISRLQNLYPESNISVTLTSIRSFIVRLTGEVIEPGIRYANATGRVSDILEQSGGLSDWANERAIEIRHSDGTVDRFDAWKYNKQGGIENNPLLRDGDEIFVPGSNFSQGTISVRSPVNRIGYYQYYQQESVFDFLKRNSFETINMDLQNVTVVRNGGNDNLETHFLTLNSGDLTLTNFYLQPNDIVILPIFETVVYVDGEVANPGSYTWIAERSASYYVSVAGRTTDASDQKEIIVTRKNEKFYGEDTIIQIGDQIHMPKKRHLVARDWLEFISPIVSIILAAKAINIF